MHRLSGAALRFLLSGFGDSRPWGGERVSSSQIRARSSTTSTTLGVLVHSFLRRHQRCTGARLALAVVIHKASLVSGWLKKAGFGNRTWDKNLAIQAAVTPLAGEQPAEAPARKGLSHPCTEVVPVPKLV